MFREFIDYEALQCALFPRITLEYMLKKMLFLLIIKIDVFLKKNIVVDKNKNDANES